MKKFFILLILTALPNIIFSSDMPIALERREPTLPKFFDYFARDALEKLKEIKNSFLRDVKLEIYNQARNKTEKTKDQTIKQLVTKTLDKTILGILKEKNLQNFYLEWIKKFITQEDSRKNLLAELIGSFPYEMNEKIIKKLGRKTGALWHIAVTISDEKLNQILQSITTEAATKLAELGLQQRQQIIQAMAKLTKAKSDLINLLKTAPKSLIIVDKVTFEIAKKSVLKILEEITKYDLETALLIINSPQISKKITFKNTKIYLNKLLTREKEKLPSEEKTKQAAKLLRILENPLFKYKRQTQDLKEIENFERYYSDEMKKLQIRYNEIRIAQLEKTQKKIGTIIDEFYQNPNLIFGKIFKRFQNYFNIESKELIKKIEEKEREIENFFKNGTSIEPADNLFSEQNEIFKKFEKLLLTAKKSATKIKNVSEAVKNKNKLKEKQKKLKKKHKSIISKNIIESTYYKNAENAHKEKTENSRIILGKLIANLNIPTLKTFNLLPKENIFVLLADDLTFEERVKNIIGQTVRNMIKAGVLEKLTQEETKRLNNLLNKLSKISISRKVEFLANILQEIERGIELR